MSKIYLEIEEQLTPEEELVKQPTIVKSEYASIDEAKPVSDGIEAMFFKNKTYTRCVHVCGHEDGTPCEKIKF
jgi:hypothetical protein